MTLNNNNLETALRVLGQLLEDRREHYEIVAICGGGLLLLGLVERTTKDLDLIALMKDGGLITADPLPSPLIKAIKEVGAALNLGPEWINTGPSSLLTLGLPQGFMKRIHSQHYKGLTLHLADRFDQICFKLYASVDQGPHSKHFADLKILHPSLHELYRNKLKSWFLASRASQPFQLPHSPLLSNRGFAQEWLTPTENSGRSYSQNSNSSTCFGINQAKAWCLTHDTSEVFALEIDHAIRSLNAS